MGDRPMLLNLEKQVQFYLSYHNDDANRRLHMLSVPIIVQTVLIFASLINVYAAAVLASLYTIYVLYLDRVAGLAFSLYAAAQAALATVLVVLVPQRILLPLAIVAHAAAWVLQLVGHYKYERNRPAIMASVAHAVLAAPVVIYLEVVFSFGLLKDLQARIDKSSGLDAAHDVPSEVQLSETEYGSLTS